MAIACRVEFSLDVIAIGSAKPGPGGEVVNRAGRIKPVHGADPDQITDDVAVVEIIPDKDLNAQLLIP